MNENRQEPSIRDEGDLGPVPIRPRADELVTIIKRYDSGGGFRYAVRGHNGNLDPEGSIEFLLNGIVTLARVIEAREEDRRGRTWARVLASLESGYQASAEHEGPGFSLVHNERKP